MYTNLGQSLDRHPLATLYGASWVLTLPWAVLRAPWDPFLILIGAAVGALLPWAFGLAAWKVTGRNPRWGLLGVVMLALMGFVGSFL